MQIEKAGAKNERAKDQQDNVEDSSDDDEPNADIEKKRDKEALKAILMKEKLAKLEEEKMKPK